MSDIPENMLETWIESSCEYFVLAKENTYSEYADTRRYSDSIVLVSRPYGTTPQNKKLHDMTLGEIQKMLRTELPNNIFLNEDYAPFQIGQKLNDFYKGFALPESIDHREFIIKAWALDSSDLYEYGELADSLVNSTSDKANANPKS